MGARGYQDVERGGSVQVSGGAGMQVGAEHTYAIHFQVIPVVLGIWCLNVLAFLMYATERRTVLTNRST